MTQRSFFWDGLSIGDANQSPYSANEFAQIMNRLLTSDTEGYVSPGYLNSLNVQASAPAAATVDVLSGGGIVKGFAFDSDATETLVIAANASGNPRIDRIILHLNFAAQTVRLAVLQGTPGASPSLPSLTQVYGTTWQISLAYIWVANGFATITNTDIHDERAYLNTAFAKPVGDNMVRDSEWIVIETNESGGLTDGATTAWSIEPSLTAGVRSQAAAARPPQQTRGNAIALTSSGFAASIVNQIVPCVPSKVYTLRLPVNTPAAGVIVEVQGASALPTFTSILTRTVRRLNSWIDETLTFTTGASDVFIRIRITCVISQVVSLGQVTLVEGYRAGAYVPVHEYIPLGQTTRNSNANWNFTTKSSGSTNIDLTTTWSTNLAPFKFGDVQAVELQVAASDTGSAAGTPQVNFAPLDGVAGNGNYGTLYLGGEVNGRIKEMRTVLPIARYNFGPTVSLGFRIVVSATGALSLTAMVALAGVYT